jgi:hypothetical protein
MVGMGVVAMVQRQQLEVLERQIAVVVVALVL